MREVPFVRKANDLALATSHLPQSSSASRVTAAQSGFFILSQSGSDRSGSRSPYASIPMPAEREDSFAPLRRPRSGELHRLERQYGPGETIANGPPVLVHPIASANCCHPNLSISATKRSGLLARSFCHRPVAFRPQQLSAPLTLHSYGCKRELRPDCYQRAGRLDRKERQPCTPARA